MQGIRLVPRHSYQRCSLGLSSAVAWDVMNVKGFSCSQSGEDKANDAGHMMHQSHASTDGGHELSHRGQGKQCHSILVVALGTRQGDVVLLRFAGGQ